MTHKFYEKSKREQKQIQLSIGLGALGLNSLILLLSVVSGVYLLVILSVAMTLTVIAPFFDTPSLTEKGKLIYYSPLFLAEEEKNGVITVHGGTLFDYVYTIDRHLSGRQRTNFIIYGYLEGILSLIEHHEDQSANSLKIRGTSYIISQKTAEKLGFSAVETDPIQVVVLIFNYLNLTIANSIAKATLSFPDLRDVRTFEANLGSLIDRKEYIKELKERLENTTANKT